MDVQAYLAERMPPVDAELQALLPAGDAPPTSLHQAMRHLVFPGGKRFRPALALAAAEAVGRAPDDALPMAAAVELVHTYSLIHDDLPCMDDDALRRGRPTVHVAFGEATALLAGDALLALAFESLARCQGPPDRVVGALALLGAAAGSASLVGGQVDDLALGRPGAAPPSVEQVESVHARKSAALIAASVAGGARLAGAPQALVDRLYLAGGELGIAFQIADDVLDCEEDGACSLVAVMGLEAARARASECLAAALQRIEDLGEPAESLRELARFAVWRQQ